MGLPNKQSKGISSLKDGGKDLEGSKETVER